MSRKWIVAAVALWLGGAGCASGSPALKGRQVVLQPSLRDSVQVTYVGNGGWLVEAGDAAIMTGILISNPNGFRVLFGNIEADPSKIDPWLKEYVDPLERVRSVLVGHGHYDHLMDVPYIVQNYLADDAKVFGSTTVLNNVVGWSGLDSTRIEVLDSVAGDDSRQGRWVYDASGRFRFQAVKTEHAPHAFFGRIHLWQGKRTRPFDEQPRWARQWVEGGTYAYVLEVLDPRGEPYFRIYYQDSGATPPLGHPAAGLIPDDGVPLLALLTAPGHDQVERYPQGILDQLQPDVVLASHWEDFLLSDLCECVGPVPATNFGGFLEKMRGSGVKRWWIPAPRSRWVFKPN